MIKTVQGETLKNIAAMRGVSYEAVVHTRDRRKIEPVGKEGRATLYDPADFAEKEAGADAQERADYRKRFEKARAEKLELDNARKRGDLVERVRVARVFSEIFSVHRSVLLSVGAGQADTIATILEKEPPGQDRTLKIQKIIDDEIYNALGAIKAAINRFLRSVGETEIEDEIPKQKAKGEDTAKKRKKPERTKPL
jgi:hypothetical protein